jgi:ATP-dependent RNA helicase RhlE
MEFKSLDLIQPILDALEKKGYKTPTPIQEQTIPLLLEGRDVIGIAQTGTGKTASFVLPILQKLHDSPAGTSSPRALVLAPTRELAAQISESFRDYGKFLDLIHTEVYGGVGSQPQIKALQRGVDILIATPGRLMDLMSQGKVDLGRVEFFVLDEADRMLDMGFVKDIKKIASSMPVEKQSLFFSATMSNTIAELTEDFLKNPERIEITPESTPVDKIEQCVFFVDQTNKKELLLDLIQQQNMDSILVFVKAKHRANRVALMLRAGGIKADAIHGDKSQYQRTRALKDFKSGRIQALVATDIAARGIDVDNISHVINFDLPNEPENYVHRIGRTARAGASGVAYSFCAAEDRNYLNQIERITKKRTPHAEHKYHSTKAKNAEGAEAKPKPRGSGGMSRGPRRSQNRSPRRGGARGPMRARSMKARSTPGSDEGRRQSRGGNSRNSSSRSRFSQRNPGSAGSSRVRRGRTARR